MLIAFVSVCVLMGLVTLASPMSEPKVLPERQDLDIQTDPKTKMLGGAVILGVIVFIVVFW